MKNDQEIKDKAQATIACSSTEAEASDTLSRNENAKSDEKLKSECDEKLKPDDTKFEKISNSPGDTGDNQKQEEKKVYSMFCYRKGCFSLGGAVV